METDHSMTAVELRKRQIRRTVRLAVLGGIGMFGFAFLLVPIYDVICDLTGLNGRTGGPYAYQPATASEDRSRVIRVRFITATNDSMPWEFQPARPWVDVHPGEQVKVDFRARNLSSNTMTGQAVPSVAPGRAAEFFHKTECFCFEQQRLEAGEEIDMPLFFVVDRELPGTVATISLSYTMFDITGRLAGR